MLSPDHYYRSVRDIDLAALSEAGINTLLVDLDNTLLPRDCDVIPEHVKAWAAGLSRRGFKACLISNNWHGRVVRVAEELGFDLIAKAVKPLPFAFMVALKRLGATRREAAIVGDQMFTDVLGGKLTGITTVLIVPMSSADLPHTLILRQVERALLAGRTPLP
jgi:HAD superfamily phosphatase (TIGR01668 family)